MGSDHYDVVVVGSGPGVSGPSLPSIGAVNPARSDSPMRL
jgi:hypothetical protein